MNDAEVQQLRKDKERLARMVKEAGVCEACEGSGAGEPDYVEHIAIPTPCEHCNGAGSDAFFKGIEHERSCNGRAILRIPEETGEAADERFVENNPSAGEMNQMRVRLSRLQRHIRLLKKSPRTDKDETNLRALDRQWEDEESP